MIRAASLGYDFRLSGQGLLDHARAHGFPARFDILPTSCDPSAAPPLFVRDIDRAADRQIVLSESLFANAFHGTFGLFRSDRDALSVLAGRTPDHVWLYRYIIYWDDIEWDAATEPFGGRFRAMVGDKPNDPTLDFDLVGYELLDESEVSVTHLYEDDLLGAEPLTPETFIERAAAVGLTGTTLARIEQARDPFRFPDR